MKSSKRTTIAALVLALALLLVGCGSGAGSPASPEPSSTEENTPAAQELVGKPWVTSILAGNLPAERPDVKDDLYAHYNYDYLAAHQEQPSETVSDHAVDMQTQITSIIKDESKSSHDLEQLRILYNQAADTETLKKTGLSEVQPYLDRIEAVSSLDEMNALLLADDFPFNPFITALVYNDMRKGNIVYVSPNFVVYDALLGGGTYYQDSDDPQVQENLQATLLSFGTKTLADLISAGMTQEEAAKALSTIISFEKTHACHVEAYDTYLKADYGAAAEAARNSVFTLDQLCAFAPNLPLKEIIVKQGKGGSESYVCTREWIEAFNGLWTEDNLDTIKLVAKAKVLGETRPYRDPTPVNAALEELGLGGSSTEEFAFEACTSLDTLGNVVAKTYLEDVLGADAKTRFEKIAQDLVNTYKELVDNTTWIDEKSRQRVIEKLEHMTLNVLEPTGGYPDYSKLELTPSDKGGTLFSNYLKLKQYRQDLESKAIGQPSVGTTTWYWVTPTMTNAFYDQASNSINILPGYAPSLIYTDEMSDEELLASIGTTIAHEISHGFDYQGSQWDAYGVPEPIFTDAAVDAFVLKCSTLALYYKGIEVMPGVTVDGELVAGEAEADLCGMQACLTLAAKTDGFDYESFFERFAYVYAQVLSQEYLQMYTLDSHPLNHLRINVNAQMFDAIYDEFGVAEGDGMYLAPNERIAIWGQES